MMRRLPTSFLLTVLAVILLCTLPACTPKTPSGQVQSSPEAAWKVFRQHYCVAKKEPAVKVKASLHYSRVKPKKRTNRTLVTLWGDFSGPMRLDVSASVGKLLAHIREDKDGLLVFYPSDKKAYAHVNPVLGATRLGMPFPFSLSELAHVMVGDFSGLTPKKYATATREKDNYVYTFDTGLVSRLELDETGRPILLEGRTTTAYETARTWRLGADRYEDVSGRNTPLAGRVTLALDNGEKGVLYIKSRQLLPAVWPDRSMALNLPDTVETVRLDNGFQPDHEDDIPVVYEDEK